MIDIVDSSTRSRMMSGIRARDTKPEMLVRSRLHRLGFRFRLHVRNLPGKPDIVLPQHRAVIFINGCFWHGHNCRYFKWPKTRVEFWRNKIEGNKLNDSKSRIALLNSGWRVGTVWECALRGAGKDGLRVAAMLESWIRSENIEIEITS